MTSFMVAVHLYHRKPHSFPTRRSSDLLCPLGPRQDEREPDDDHYEDRQPDERRGLQGAVRLVLERQERERHDREDEIRDRKSTRLNSSHLGISYAVFCLKKKKVKK